MEPPEAPAEPSLRIHQILKLELNLASVNCGHAMFVQEIVTDHADIVYVQKEVNEVGEWTRYADDYVKECYMAMSEPRQSGFLAYMNALHTPSEWYRIMVRMYINNDYDVKGKNTRRRFMNDLLLCVLRNAERDEDNLAAAKKRAERAAKRRKSRSTKR